MTTPSPIAGIVGRFLPDGATEYRKGGLSCEIHEGRSGCYVITRTEGRTGYDLKDLATRADAVNYVEGILCAAS
jgi:hypothetical protein